MMETFSLTNFTLMDPLLTQYNLVDTGRKLNVHKTSRRRPERLLNVLCTLNLRTMSMGNNNKNFAWYPRISYILSIIFYSMDINSHLCKFLHQQASSRTQFSVALTFCCSTIPAWSLSGRLVLK